MESAELTPPYSKIYWTQFDDTSILYSYTKFFAPIPIAIVKTEVPGGKTASENHSEYYLI